MLPVPGIPGRRGDGAPCELVCPGLAEQYRAGLTKPANRGCILEWKGYARCRASGGRRHVPGEVVVLNGDGNAMQRSAPLAGPDFRLCLACLPQRGIGRKVDVALQGPVVSSDAVEEAFGERDRR